MCEPEETTQTSVQERPEGVQRCQAEGQCSIQPQHRESNQHVSRSRQYSQRGSDSAVRCGCTLRIDQIVNTNRSRRGAGTHVYNPHLPHICSTSSNVCKAGALVPSPPCLGEGPHGWVPVDTHSTPVLTTVRRLWVAYVLYEPNVPQEHAQPAHFRIDAWTFCFKSVSGSCCCVVLCLVCAVCARCVCGVVCVFYGILTGKSFVVLGERGERHIEPSGSLFLPQFPSG